MPAADIRRSGVRDGALEQRIDLRAGLKKKLSDFSRL
jgi:hypothetical protein